MRVTYDKEMREKAKRDGRGLITIDIVRADGCRSTMQVMASERIVHYAYHALNHIEDIGKISPSKA